MSRSSPRSPSRTAPARSSESSRAGCAAPTSRSWMPITRAPCSGTRPLPRLDDGRRVALVHHASCGECERCLAGHESTCERFAAPTIRPGRVRRAGERAGVGRPASGLARLARDDGRAARVRAAWRAPRTAAVASSSSATASSAASSAPCSRGAATRCSRSTSIRAARDVAPDGPVDAVVLCGRGGVEHRARLARAGRHGARLRRRRLDPGGRGLPAAS